MFMMMVPNINSKSTYTFLIDHMEYRYFMLSIAGTTILADVTSECVFI